MSSGGIHITFTELIQKKRDGKEMGKEEINFFINSVKNKSIQECQIGAMLMAIWLKGMTTEETLALTQEMMMSGEVLQWPAEWKEFVVDKHSTGGVGDKVSLPLAPALAACGCKVPMISGRGLAHTGGTLDKLESVPGFNIHQSSEQVKKILQDVGCCIIGQTENLVPADMVLYAIRNATATIDSLPLITGSIISKKAAESLSALVMDVKYGKAAFYKDISSARELAQSLVTVGSKLGIRTGAILSKMNNPIGHSIGNSLEVIEAIECLKGRGSADLRELVECLGGYLLWLCGMANTINCGKELIVNTLKNGQALDKFQAMLEAQGVEQNTAHFLCKGEPDYFTVFRRAQHLAELKTEKEGTILEISGLTLAEVLCELGAGRTKVGEVINHSVGAELLVCVGQCVKKGDSWVRVHYDIPALKEDQIARLQAALTIGSSTEFNDSPLVTEFILPK
ncbi:thymidine phosphorylase [Polypterus senegalus]|nr:thymidine phosphorylase [Polypterus senegalus]